MPLIEIVMPLLAAAEIREPLVPLWAMERAADIFLGAWLFFVGVSVGSFLNVVVYRLPRGLNLVHPPSRCPSCLHPIRLRDNVPILSWLLLGGKCRDCQARYSSRYFWVELLMGSVFLGVWLLEANVAYAFWENDPVRRPLDGHNLLAFWCAYGLHVALFATVLGGALIHGDRFRTPPTLFVPVLIAGFVLPLFWPEIRRLPASPSTPHGGWQAGAIDGVVGIAAGALLALLGAGFRVLAGRGWPAFAPVMLMASLGVVLGWQRMLLAAPAVVLLYVAAAFALWLLGPLPSLPQPSLPQPSIPQSPDALLPDSPETETPPLPAEPEITHEPNQPAR